MDDGKNTAENAEDGKKVIEELNCKMDPRLEPVVTVQLDRNKDSPQDTADEDMREMGGSWICAGYVCTILAYT